jgi:cytochrome c biogenesis protein CcmG/thiol:disulfide interchange protein DsbE
MKNRALRSPAVFWLIGLAGWFVLSVGLACAADPAPTAVELKTVSYDGLADAIKAQRGKVVVVDAWGDFCLPCKKEFPSLVALHRRYGKDGLVCMSVSLDATEKRPDVLKFLTKSEATFANFLLDEKPEVWQQKWKIVGPPAVFVFDRQGRRAAKFDAENPDRPYTYDDVEKLVKDLLREQP